MRALLLLALSVLCSAQNDPFLNMQTIASSLGVECQYCHGDGRNAKREIARAMIAMTREMNTKVKDVAGKQAAVGCITCHRGVPIPQQLGDILFQTTRSQGVAAAVTQYRDLRERFYGRQAYDFSEEVLLTLADRVVQTRPDDAIALMKLNLEFNPKSARAWSSIAFAYTRKLDDDAAIAAYEKSLEFDPKNGVVQGQLEQLKDYQRRRKR